MSTDTTVFFLCGGFEQANKEKYVSLLLNKRIDALILVGSTYAGEEETTGRPITCGMRRRRFLCL